MPVRSPSRSEHFLWMTSLLPTTPMPTPSPALAMSDLLHSHRLRHPSTDEVNHISFPNQRVVYFTTIFVAGYCFSDAYKECGQYFTPTTTRTTKPDPTRIELEEDTKNVTTMEGDGRALDILSSRVLSFDATYSLMLQYVI
ncbi:hypothetical protein D9758_001767 [Tetrapyrgos nigripes]|uniref:Uncharacterized protein n=1 Tax=Tetrapyrgos nigripes TaxID=182062 RepID=A0A8H5GXP4_9AGAR|nr:hypothetical protein D9758_001767 [Tetrapyrgos nigripes]